MYLKDIEEVLYLTTWKRIDIDLVKLFIFLYADDKTLLSEPREGLQEGLNILETIRPDAN